MYMCMYNTDILNPFHCSNIKYIWITFKLRATSNGNDITHSYIWDRSEGGKINPPPSPPKKYMYSPIKNIFTQYLNIRFIYLAYSTKTGTNQIKATNFMLI